MVDLAGSEPVKPPVSHNQQAEIPDRLKILPFMKNETSCALSQVDEPGVFMRSSVPSEDEECGDDYDKIL